MPGRTTSASFVVRLRVDGSRGGWWGEVQHVESGERVAFRDNRKLWGFLCRHLRSLLRRHRRVGVGQMPEVQR